MVIVVELTSHGVRPEIANRTGLDASLLSEFQTLFRSSSNSVCEFSMKRLPFQ